MTSSLKTSFLSEVATGDVIPHGKLAYFQERQRNRVYNFVLTKFLEKERAGSLTRAELARRIQCRPEQITKWLGAPGNWTLDTISNLLLGIGAEELEFSSVSLLSRAARNATQPAWLREIGQVEGPKHHQLGEESRSQSNAQAKSAGLGAKSQAAA